jgi:hypothetical protein
MKTALCVIVIMALVGCSSVNELCQQRCIEELGAAKSTKAAGVDLESKAAEEVDETLADIIVEQCTRVCAIGAQYGAPACYALCRLLGIGGCEAYCEVEG